MSLVSIKKGSTLGTMVRAYNKAHGASLTVAQVATANGLKDANKVRAGGKLLFPDSFETRAKPSIFKNGDDKPIVRNAVREEVTVKAEQEQVTTLPGQVSTQVQQRPLERLPNVPVPTPGSNLTEPSFPGPNGTVSQFMRYEVDVQRYFDALAAQAQASTPAASTSSSSPVSQAQTTATSQAQTAGTIEDKAAAALGALEEPEFPGKDATPQQLAEFQKKLGSYNRMYELMSKVMANAHDMKKALIANLPR